MNRIATSPFGQPAAWTTLVVVCLLAPSATVTADEPVYPAANWAFRAPAEVGLDAGKLDAFRDFVDGRGCVVRHGYFAYSWGDVSRRADVASACKPWFTHFLFVAIEDGKIKSVDEPVVSIEPRLGGLNAGLGTKDRAIRWRDLACQTSCYGVAERPGEAFDYSDFNMALFFDALFGKVHGMTWDKIDDGVLRPRLTTLLECEDEPTFMAFGRDSRPGRLAISARDFSRFGLLYLRGGKWRDKQLISAQHVRLAVTSPLPNAVPRTAGRPAEMIDGQRSIGGGNNQTDHLGSYSFAWWTNGVDRDGRRHWPDAPEDCYGAFGHAGRRAMVVIPSLDLVVSSPSGSAGQCRQGSVAFRSAKGRALSRSERRLPWELERLDNRQPRKGELRTRSPCGSISECRAASARRGDQVTSIA